LRFKDIRIPETGAYWLQRARVPRLLLDASLAGASTDREGSPLVDVRIDGGRIAAIQATGAALDGAPAVDLGECQVWPRLIDMHVHLDKCFVIPRSMPDGTWTCGRVNTVKDRAYWTYDDLRRRMTFALRCAYAHGVGAIRTHLDSYEDMRGTGWDVFRDLRAEWAGRVSIQAVSLVAIDTFRTEYGARLSDLVAKYGGVLGAATRGTSSDHVGTLSDMDALLDTLLRLAAERGLDVDLHVDESPDLTAYSLPRIAAAAIRNRFKGKIVCGHCVNLSLQPEKVLRETVALCADSQIGIVTLPACMMYLQDRSLMRAPRWRGVTAFQELRVAGVPVAVGGDNVRDMWYPYGDFDIVDTFQQAVRILQLDHPFLPDVVGSIPAELIREKEVGTVKVGAPAGFILFNARTVDELMCRPQSDRVVVNAGKVVNDELPDYSELEHAK
jgi:cytosine/creatinine deaminase